MYMYFICIFCMNNVLFKAKLRKLEYLDNIIFANKHAVLLASICILG